VQVRLLGSMEVTIQGRPVRLGGKRQRAVLALLLLHANRRVSRDRLIEDVWDGRPPPQAIQTLQSYVSRLRRLLGQEVQISARQGGYLITLPTEALDVERFRDLTGRGHGALRSAQYDEASRVLGEALSLWRGEPLADLDDIAIVRCATREWNELHLTALSDRIEADIEQGSAKTVIGELEALVGHHPYHEQFLALHMRALYLAGRQIEALAAYRHARETLIGRYGIEPSEQLRTLERAILAQDPALLPAAPNNDHEDPGAIIAASDRTPPSSPPRRPPQSLGSATHTWHNHSACRDHARGVRSLFPHTTHTEEGSLAGDRPGSSRGRPPRGHRSRPTTPCADRTLAPRNKKHCRTRLLRSRAVMRLEES
jgi:DNA-binding SARP family transcriptional activator